MTTVEELSAPAVTIALDDNGLELNVSLALDRLTGLPADKRWRLGLSAVIEETSGRKSCWALAHPPGKPDFHHSDCFVLWLPAASRA
jgi:MOSC domain-containing protein YiiM